MVSFIWGLILEAILYFVARLFNSSALILLAVILAVIMVCSLVTLLTGIRSVSVSIQTPVSIAERNTPFFIHLKIKNKMRIGCKYMRIHVEYLNSVKLKKEKVNLTAEYVPFGESDYKYEIKITRPGNYEFTVRKVRIYDLLGLFYLNRRTVSSTNAMVLPEINALPVEIGERVRNFYGEADVFDELRPGYDPNESFGVREFRPGDKLPRVHWKLSAKVDDLMIRENSLPKTCAVVLILNLDGKNYEKMLEQAFNLSFSMMDAGCQHYVSWFGKSSGDMIRTRVDDEESFYRCLVTYMQDCLPGVTSEIMIRYRDKYRREQGLYEFLFEAGQIYKNGDIITDSDFNELVIN